MILEITFRLFLKCLKFVRKHSAVGLFQIGFVSINDGSIQ